MDNPGSAESYLKKSEGTFIKRIIVGGIIGADFITMVDAHWMLQKKNAIGLETFSLSYDTPPDLPRQIIGILETPKNSSTSGLQPENRPIKIDMDPDKIP